MQRRKKSALEYWCKGPPCVLMLSLWNTSHNISSFTADCNCCLSNWDAWLRDWEFNYIIFHSMQMNRDGLILVSTMFFSTLASYHFASSFNHTVNWVIHLLWVHVYHTTSFCFFSLIMYDFSAPKSQPFCRENVHWVFWTSCESVMEHSSRLYGLSGQLSAILYPCYHNK